MAKDIFTAEWFPYYFERFEGSDKVAVMSLAEEGAYHRAIRLAWKYGSVPANPELLAAKIQKRCTVKIAEKVLECFEPMPGNPSRMFHPVIEEIREVQEQKYKNKVKGGKAAAEARKLSVENKDTSSTSPTVLEHKSSSKRDLDREKEKEDLSVFVLGDPNEAENEFIAEVIDGIKTRQKLNFIRDEAGWSDTAIFARTNNFTAATVLECYDLLRQQKWRNGPVTPKIVSDNIANLENLRIEIKEQNNAGNKKTNARNRPRAESDEQDSRDFLASLNARPLPVM